jgi:hypothetical protein
MKTKQYYIHINTECLPHYFTTGCIKPSGLYERRPSDVQSKYIHDILLSETKWGENNDCTILVVLNENELSILDNYDNNALYNGILPLSRIKSIIFSNNTREKAEDIIWNIENGAGYVPSHWIKYEEPNRTEVSEYPKSEKIPNNNLDDLGKIAGRYNRLLGGVAFLRTALFDFNDTQINYPVNYASTVSFFNLEIESLLKEKSVTHSHLLQSYLNGEASFFKHMARKMDDETLESFANEEKIQLERKLGKYKLELIPKNSETFKVAVLNEYGDSRAKSTEDLIGTLFKDMEYYKREEIALIYGINNGYESLRNYFKINNRNISVKFELETKFDYIVMESVFNYVTNKNIKSSTLDYLDEVLIMLPKKHTKTSKGYVSYEIMGAVITTKVKDYNEILKSMLSNISNEISGWFPFNISHSDLEEKISSIIKPEFTKLIKEVRLDAVNELTSDNNIETTETNVVELEVDNDVGVSDSSNIESNKKIPVNISDAKVDYQNLNITDLKKIAKKHGINELSKFNKSNREDLVNEIIRFEESNPSML